jgi:hypothetical protein
LMWQWRSYSCDDDVMLFVVMMMRGYLFPWFSYILLFLLHIFLWFNCYLFRNIPKKSGTAPVPTAVLFQFFPRSNSGTLIFLSGENLKTWLGRRQCRQHSLLALFLDEQSWRHCHQHNCHLLFVEVGPTLAYADGRPCRWLVLAVAMVFVPTAAAVLTAYMLASTPARPVGLVPMASVAVPTARGHRALDWLW